MKFDVGTRIQQICAERGISLKQLMKESGFICSNTEGNFLLYVNP